MPFNHPRSPVGEYLPPLCCSTAPRWFSAPNNRLRWKKMCIKTNSYRAWKVPSQVHKKDRGKRATCKRKDKTNVEWEVKIPPTHKQINFHALFTDCAVRHRYISPIKEKTFSVLFTSKLQHCPRVKIQGSSWGVRPVYKSNSTRGVWGVCFFILEARYLFKELLHWTGSRFENCSQYL